MRSYGKNDHMVNEIIFMFLFLNSKGSFGAQDTKAGYDKTIISYFNPLFGTPIGNDNLNPFLILSYSPFVIFILGF